MSAWLIFMLALAGGSPAADDGACPAGTTAEVPAGSSYDHGLWSTNGTVWGYSPLEDSCIVVLP